MNNKKEITKVIVLALVFVVVYISLYIYDLKTGAITNISSDIYNIIVSK